MNELAEKKCAEVDRSQGNRASKEKTNLVNQECKGRQEISRWSRDLGQWGALLMRSHALGFKKAKTSLRGRLCGEC